GGGVRRKAVGGWGGGVGEKGRSWGEGHGKGGCSGGPWRGGRTRRSRSATSRRSRATPRAWEHQRLMLATSLCPEGCLVIGTASVPAFESPSDVSDWDLHPPSPSRG